MTSFIIQHISLRFKLFYRNFELGLLFWILPLIVFGGIFYLIHNHSGFIHAKQLQLLLGNIFVIAWAHNKRKDDHFLKRALTFTQLKLIYFIEYILLSIPFIILALGVKNWIHLSIFILILGVIFIPFSLNKKVKTISIFKKWNIEWNSGFRTHGLIPIITLLIYITSFLLPTTSYFNLFIYGLTILSFTAFQTIEEESVFIRIFDCSPQHFLIQKIKIHLFPLLLFCLATTIPILFTEISHWAIIILILSQGITYNLNTIIGKYANYQNEAGKVITSIVKVIFSIVPFLLPLNIVLSIFLYKKAIHSLTPYLYVDNK